MRKTFWNIIFSLWPELRAYPYQRRLIGAGDIASTLWSLPLALIGLIWLITITDLTVITTHWTDFILFGALQYVFFRFSFFIIFEIRFDRYASADGSLVSMVQWALLFLLGPSALWLSASWMLFNFLRNNLRRQTTATRWVLFRNATHSIATLTLGSLTGLLVYKRLGATYPIPELTLNAILPAFVAIGVSSLILFTIWSVYITLGMYTQRKFAGKESQKVLIGFISLALGLSELANPFGIQAAAIYNQNGTLMFLFFMSGLMIVAFLGRSLSWAVESNRQRTRQLQQLENLGRAILNAEPSASDLPAILEKHVPAMFPSARIHIQIFPNTVLLIKPGDWHPDMEPLWQWGCTNPNIHAFLARDPLPWVDVATIHDPIVVSPIISLNDSSAIGCVYIELRSLSQPWNRKALQSLFPAVKTLADQIASALNKAQIYRESLELEAARQELKFAGRIQSSFFPKDIPTLDGWEMAMTLLPARETSGDFLDIFSLENGKLGVLIADVADKGLGAALYMALCRTLIRTYALEYQENEPDLVFSATNQRLLKDARANLFVTAFLGIIDPNTSKLTYCNAGHNPPYLFKRLQRGYFTSLSATGMPLGIEGKATWKKETIDIETGDVLLLYTDGIPETRNELGELYRESRFTESIHTNLDLPAEDLLVSLINEIQRFAGNTPQADDIAMFIISKCC